MTILEVGIEGFEMNFLDSGSFLKLASREEFVWSGAIIAPL